MTETTADRIRWEPNGRDTGWCGFVGTMKPWAFQIWHAGTPGNPWRLDSALLGQFGFHVDHPDPEALKRHAGRWLEEFVSFLGAIFPDEPTRPSRAWHADWAEVDRDQSGNAILRHKPTGGMYKILPVEEC